MPHSRTANTAGPTLADYQWLTTAAAMPHLAWAAASMLPLTAQAGQLRRQLSPQQAHLVLEQTALRERSRAKFAAAGQMFFTARGLEQATDEFVAAHKAARFAPGLTVFDLCCGIGGDLLALARRGPATGFDRDPIAATLVEASGHAVLGQEMHRAAAGCPPRVVVRDVEEVDVAECSAWHLDPDRRPHGRRTTRVDLHEPGPGTIERLLARNPNAAIKLAPAAQLPAGWPDRAELEWISRGRECRQLVAWFGSLTRDAGQRKATVLRGPEGAARSLLGAGEIHPPVAERIDRYVFEPDAAVLAARLGGVLAAEHGLTAIAQGLAYWTGPHAIGDPALACFEVLEVLPFRLKQVAGWLHARGVGQLEIKKRGVALDPQEIRRKLRLAGGAAATLLVATIEWRVTAIIARRVDVV